MFHQLICNILLYAFIYYVYKFLINGISDVFSAAKDLQVKIADLNQYKAKFEKAEIKIKVKSIFKKIYCFFWFFN